MKSLLLRRFPLLVVMFLVAPSLRAAANDAPSPLLGRWALTLPNGGAGWLEITKENGWYRRLAALGRRIRGSSARVWLWRATR
jgi:hypothetical protein